MIALFDRRWNDVVEQGCTLRVAEMLPQRWRAILTNTSARVYCESWSRIEEVARTVAAGPLAPSVPRLSHVSFRCPLCGTWLLYARATGSGPERRRTLRAVADADRIFAGHCLTDGCITTQAKRDGLAQGLWPAAYWMTQKAWLIPLLGNALVLPGARKRDGLWVPLTRLRTVVELVGSEEQHALSPNQRRQWWRGRALEELVNALEAGVSDYVASKCDYWRNVLSDNLWERQMWALDQQYGLTDYPPSPRFWMTRDECERTYTSAGELVTLPVTDYSVGELAAIAAIPGVEVCER